MKRPVFILLLTNCVFMGLHLLETARMTPPTTMRTRHVRDSTHTRQQFNTPSSSSNATPRLFDEQHALSSKKKTTHWVPLDRRCSREHDVSESGFRVIEDEKEMARQIQDRHNEKGALLFPREHPRKLIHGMTFDCEEWLLDIKLNEIGDVVDHFIIVEGAFTLQNTPRQQCFPEIARTNDGIARWMHKVIYVYDEKPISGFVYWEAEVYYRDLIGLSGLQRVPGPLSGDDLVIITDVDELIAPAFLRVLKQHDGVRTPIHVHLRWSYYSYSWMNRASWGVNAIVTVEELTLLGKNRTNQVRVDLVSNAAAGWTTGPNMIVGWHCSWCMPTMKFLDKISHFAHSELNRERFRDVHFLENMRRNGLWFPDAAPNACVQSQPQYPSYVSRDPSRFYDIL